MATVNQVQALYISYFGRPADSQGLKYWTEDVGASAPLEQIANGFAATEEYLASIQGETVQEIITDFYENLIGRAPEAAGLDYWVQEVLSGRTTTQLVGLRITQAVDAFPDDNADKITAEAKCYNIIGFYAVTELLRNNTLFDQLYRGRVAQLAILTTTHTLQPPDGMWIRKSELRRGQRGSHSGV